jgi:hypothetical protein
MYKDIHGTKVNEIDFVRLRRTNKYDEIIFIVKKTNIPPYKNNLNFVINIILIFYQF